MAIFRIEKTRDYTVMSNHHLKDMRMSLKSKGLLSMILSLPNEWNYTTRGLASISREGVDSIGTALKELEQLGYLIRNRLRDERGRITDTEYVIYEQPYTTSPHPPPPDTENPYTVKSDTEKPAQLSKDKSIPKQSITHLSSTHPSIPQAAAVPQDSIDTIRATIKKNIDFEILCLNHPRQFDVLEEILELMVEIMTTAKSHIRIGGENKLREVVKSRFMKITSEHIEYVITCLNENTTDVRNIKSYLITSLYNAPATIDNYYQARVNHDLYGTR